MEEIEVRLQLDDDGYLRRECPHCEREFKWRHTEGTGGSEPPDYYCPYCGHAADAGSWWTKVQLAHIEPLVAGAFLDDLEQELEGGEGLSITLERPPSAGPSVLEPEPNDMRRVASPCHADEPVKVVEGWTGPIHCLSCGAVFRG